MAYQSMSLEEFAKHVGMNAYEVQQLADRDKLPGHRVGGRWRFNQARVTEWLQQEIHTLDQPRLVALERAMSGSAAGTADHTNLVVTNMIGLEGVDAALRANTKASVLSELVKLAGRTGLLYDDQGLLEAVRDRESVRSTAFPLSIAIPHARQPMPYVSAEPLICVGRVPSGIGFGAPDGELTRLFFLVCCHSDRHHLQVLARLMRILEVETINALLLADASDEMLEILIAKEEQVMARKT